MRDPLRFTRALAIVVAVTLTAGLVAIAPPARAAAPPVASALGTFVPRAQNIFNTPTAAGGSHAESYQLSTFVEKTLRSMAPRAVARIATYNLTVPSTADAIVQAARRGVFVRVIFDGGDTIQEQQVMQALGSDVKANHSYAIACRYSCNSGLVSAMHSKFFTFSSTGSPHTSENVSVVGSANLSDTNQYLNWNESRVMTDPTIFAGLAKFFDAMRFDADNEQVFSTFASADGKDRVYMWPSGSTGSDVFLAGLNAVKCKGTAAGYGTAARRTIVRVSMFYWVASRYKIANRLVALKKAGCDVAVMYSNNPLQPGFAQTLATRLYQGGVPLYNTRHGSGDALIYSHSKMLLINGIVYGQSRALTYNGSANWTRNALVRGNEVDTRTEGLATYQAFAARWNLVRSGSLRDLRVPITTPPLTPRQRTETDPADVGDEDLERI